VYLTPSAASIENTSFSLEDTCNAVDDRDSRFFGYLGYFFDVDGVLEVGLTEDVDMAE